MTPKHDNKQGDKSDDTLGKKPGEKPGKRPAVERDAVSLSTAPAESPEEAATTPGDNPMGLVQLTLDKGVRTTAIGQLYGLDFEIEAKGFAVRVFFDNYNRRLKVLDYEASDPRAMVTRLRWLARENGFDKIFLMASRSDWEDYLSQGFVLEGILKYFHGGEDAFVMSHFGSKERAYSPKVIEQNDIIERVTSKPRNYVPPALPEGYREVLCDASHIPAMVRLYRRTFRTYPSPLREPDYVLQTMQRHIIYRAVLGPDGELLSAASAEIDQKHSGAELSDCATRRSERGKGLMYHLLLRLERDLAERGLRMGWTYARAASEGMNRVFYRLGYEYTGRLVQSCDIAGQMEDMNLWVKLLPKPPAGSEAAAAGGKGKAPGVKG